MSKAIPNEITNSEDVIDSRDVIERIEYLESLRDDFQVDNDLPDYIPTDTTTDDSITKWSDNEVEKWSEWEDSDEGQELKALKDLQDGLEDYCPDWKYGTTLIRDSYFEEYAEELVKDIGDMPKDIPAYIEIDWKKTAENIQEDYTSEKFDGVTYWAR